MVTAVLQATTWPRPFLKWAGGKGRLLEQYRAFLPLTFDTYYEPFLGGGAVFFALSGSFQSAVLADINPELVNVYQCVRNQVEAVIALLQDHKQQHCQAHYYAVRAQTNLSDPLERAARLLYLNKTCYNGLYRENSKGCFNVPMGRYKNPAICDPLLLRAAAAALQPARIRQASFDFLLEQPLSDRDFVYFDPPYYPISPTSSFTGYSRYGFSAADQAQLSQIFRTLAALGVQVMLSNSDCPFIRELYQGFSMHSIQAARAINSKAGQRGKITELLITSFAVPN